MGDLSGELKKIPVWGWVVAGLLLAGVVITVMRRKSATAATAATGVAGAVPNSSSLNSTGSTLTAPDAGVFEAQQAASLASIEQYLSGASAANNNLNNSTLATVGADGTVAPSGNFVKDIQAQYEASLGHAPSFAAQSYWQNAMATWADPSVSEPLVLKGIANSQEAQLFSLLQLDPKANIGNTKIDPGWTGVQHILYPNGPAATAPVVTPGAVAAPGSTAAAWAAAQPIIPKVA